MTMVVRFSLASRTLLWVLLTSALLTALATVWAVNVERERMIEAAHTEVRNAVAGRLTAIAGAVWAYDEETLNAILNGLINANSIQSVRVTGVDLTVEAVRPSAAAAIEAHWSTALMDPSGKREIGRIEVFETHTTLQQLLNERLTLLAVTEILTMLALTVVLFIIVNYQITRHLRAVATAVTRLTETDQRTAITLARPARAYPDELDVVVNAINQFSQARHRAEAALLELNRELEHRIEERTLALQDSNAELAKARDVATAASQTKSDFLANMSHEIRTPLNAIIGMSSLAERTELTAQQRGYITKAHAAADALLGIINDMLDFSKIEAGKLELEQQPFLLDDVIEQVTSLVAFRAHDKQLEFLLDISPEVPPGLIGDALRLNQVLLNLCNNAIKFTHQGEVVLRIELGARQPATADQVALRFAVRDSGIGISEAQIGKLFQPFSQADASMTRQFGGTGLGLAICRQLVGLMGGEIGVSSEPGVGSEFWFELVLPVAHQVARGERALLLEKDRQRLRVLVVDDHQTARVITGKLLSMLGFAHSWVDGGDDALRELQRADQAGQPYSLVLLDWQPAEHDGMALLGKIRALRREALPPIKVMLFSAAHETLATPGGNGFDGYLAKPATLSSLLDAILSVCGTAAVAPAAISDGAKPEGIRWRILQGSRVLLVEDNELNQQLAIEILKLDAGIQVSVARNGREAVTRLQQQPNDFDAALMDIQMPELDGYQATQQIRQQLGLTDLPIIAMTAHAMSQEADRCFAAGMNDFVSKPFLPDTLLSTLSRWIRPASSAGSGNGADGSAASRVVAAGNGAELAGLDTGVGISYCRGKLSLYRNVLQVFMDTREHSANEIRAALQQHELATANRIAHTVKSVAGTVGALRLARAAGELELAFSNNDSSQFEPLLRVFTQELAEVLALGRAYLQTPSE